MNIKLLINMLRKSLTVAKSEYEACIANGDHTGRLMNHGIIIGIRSSLNALALASNDPDIDTLRKEADAVIDASLAVPFI